MDVPLPTPAVQIGVVVPPPPGLGPAVQPAVEEPEPDVVSGLSNAPATVTQPAGGNPSAAVDGILLDNDATTDPSNPEFSI